MSGNVLFDNYSGVVAFIEVRSNTENRFEGISKQMEMLGAKVKIYNVVKIMNMSCRCTHMCEGNFSSVHGLAFLPLLVGKHGCNAKIVQQPR